LVIGKRAELADSVEHLAKNMQQSVFMQLQENRYRLDRAAGSYVFREPLRMIEQRHQYLDDLESRMKNTSNFALKNSEGTLERLSMALNVLNPRRVLERGYAFVTDSESRVVSSSKLDDGSRLNLHFADGSVAVKVER
jgi:exodeoxyribonuclease VII large subunit